MAARARRPLAVLNGSHIVKDSYEREAEDEEPLSPAPAPGEVEMLLPDTPSPPPRKASVVCVDGKALEAPPVRTLSRKASVASCADSETLELPARHRRDSVHPGAARKVSLGVKYSHARPDHASMLRHAQGDDRADNAFFRALDDDDDDDDDDNEEAEKEEGKDNDDDKEGDGVRRMQKHLNRRGSNLTDSAILNFPSYYTKHSQRHVASSDEQGFHCGAVLDPLSRGLGLWIQFVLVFALYEVTVLPWRMAFEPTMRSAAFVALDVLSDVTFAIDLLVRLRTGFYVHHTLVDSPERIFRRYLRSWLLVDALACLPLDFISMYDARFRLLKVARASYLFRFSTTMHVEPTPGVDDAHVTKLARLAFQVGLLGHFTACLRRVTVAESEGFLESLLWSMSIISSLGATAIPDGTDESVFAVFVMVLGVLTFAYVIGRTGSIVEQMDLGSRAHQAEMQRLHAFMVENKLSASLRDRIERFSSYVHTVMASEPPLVNELPLSLRMDIAMQTSRGVVLSRASIFRELEAGFLRALALDVLVGVTVPGELVLEKDKPSDRMFFVRDGELEVVIGSALAQSVVATLRSGDSFGEYGMLGIVPCASATIRSSTFCTLVILGKGALDSVMRRFPRSGAIVRERAQFYWNQSRKSDKRAIADDRDRIYGSRKRWQRVRRYIFLRKVMRWMRRPQQIGSRNGVFHPKDVNIQHLAALVFAFSVYNALAVPFRVAFVPNTHWTAYCLDYAGDLVLWVGVIMRFFTGYFERGQLIMNHHLIRHRYMRTEFALDVLSLLPIDFAALGNPAFRLPRVLRVVRIDQGLRHFVQSSQRPAILSLVRLSGILLFLVHVISCIFWLFTDLDGYAVTLEEWLPQAALEDASVTAQYARALIFGFALLTGVSKHPQPTGDLAIVFTTVGMLLGMFVIASFINNMSVMLANLQAMAVEFARRAVLLRRFLEAEGVVDHGRVVRFLTTLWSREHGLDSNDVITALPRPLRADVVTEIGGKALERMFHPDLARAVASRVVMANFPPNETIYQRGDVGTEFFVITDGLVEITSGSATRSVSVGSSFGALAMWEGRRATTATARTPTSCFVLHAVDFRALCRSESTFLEIMVAKAKRERRHARAGKGKGVDDWELPEDVALFRSIVQEKENRVKEVQVLGMDTAAH